MKVAVGGLVLLSLVLPWTLLLTLPAVAILYVFVLATPKRATNEIPYHTYVATPVLAPVQQPTYHQPTYQRIGYDI